MPILSLEDFIMKPIKKKSFGSKEKEETKESKLKAASIYYYNELIDDLYQKRIRKNKLTKSKSLDSRS